MTEKVPGQLLTLRLHSLDLHPDITFKLHGDSLGCGGIQSKILFLIQKALLHKPLEEALLLDYDPQTLPEVVGEVSALSDVHRFQLHLTLVPVLHEEVAPLLLVAAIVEDLWSIKLCLRPHTHVIYTVHLLLHLLLLLFNILL